MQKIIFSLILLLAFTGCQDKEKQQKDQVAHDAQIAKQAKAELLAEIEKEKKTQTEKNAKLSHMGVQMDKGTITIDTNKTKDFFKDLGQRMDIQMKQISNDLQKGIIDAQASGVHIDNGNINIDLNKTQTLLNDWSQKIDIFVKEFDNITKEIEYNRTKETH